MWPDLTPVNTKDYKDTDFVLPCGPVELARRTIYLCNDMFERSNPWIWCVCFLKKPYPKWLELIAKWSHIMYQIGPWAREMENSKPLFTLKIGVLKNQRIILSYGSKMYQLKCVGTAQSSFFLYGEYFAMAAREKVKMSSVQRCTSTMHMFLLTCRYIHTCCSSRIILLNPRFFPHLAFICHAFCCAA